MYLQHEHGLIQYQFQLLKFRLVEAKLDVLMAGIYHNVGLAVGEVDAIGIKIQFGYCLTKAGKIIDFEADKQVLIKHPHALAAFANGDVEVIARDQNVGFTLAHFIGFVSAPPAS